MPWKGVSVSEQRQRFLEDYLLNYYSISELAERFSVSRTTAHKWVNRFNQHGQEGYKELSRRPHTCPWQIDQAIVGAPPNIYENAGRVNRIISESNRTVRS